jgi:hypothetical protein
MIDVSNLDAYFEVILIMTKLSNLDANIGVILGYFHNNTGV